MKKIFRNRGLPSLKESAFDRRRQLVTGRARVGGGIPPKVFLAGLAFLVVVGVLYFRNSQAELERQRSGIFNKQRATAQLLGPKLIPLRDEIEGYVKQLSVQGRDFVAPDVDFARVLGSPSIYLRVRQDEVHSLDTLRKAAAESLRDGFTSCLLRGSAEQGISMRKDCQESTECQAGEFCNEFKKCSRPNSPYNMRLLYRGLLILSDAWIEQVKEAGNDYKLIAYERSLDSVTQVDIPIAIEVHQRSKYAVIVVDEDPKAGLPKPISDAYESPAERVQRVPHDARIGIWELGSGTQLVRFRGRAEGELRAAGTRPLSQSPLAEAARARMANSCGLALALKAELFPTITAEP